MSGDNRPRISVILPVLNGERYLAGCLESILSQDFKDFELIIGDNCSEDASWAIITACKDERVRSVKYEERVGLFRSLNRLIEMARGPLIRFICHDDLMKPDCLRREVDFFSRHPAVGMSYCKWEIINDTAKIISQCGLNDLPDVISPRVAMQLFFYYGCIVGNLSSVCVRRNCFREAGLFDESLGVSGDYDMWARVCEKYSLGILHRHLVQLRNHSNRLSLQKDSGLKFIRQNRQIRRKLFELLPPEIRSWARVYQFCNYNVSDAHYGLRCLLKGWWSQFYQVIRTVGVMSFLAGALLDVLTWNHHLLNLKPRFTSEGKLAAKGLNTQ